MNLCEIVAVITAGENPQGTAFPLPATVPSFYCSNRDRGGGGTGVGVQLNPGPGGHVAHKVSLHEYLMLANGLKRLTVNVTGPLGGHVCQVGTYKPRVVLKRFWARSRKQSFAGPQPSEIVDFLLLYGRLSGELLDCNFCCKQLALL